MKGTGLQHPPFYTAARPTHRKCPLPSDSASISARARALPLVTGMFVSFRAG